MTKEQYLKLAEPFYRDPEKVNVLEKTNQGITALVYTSYLAAAAVLAEKHDRRLPRFLGVPAAGFLAVSVFRKKLNARRPYEIWDIRPLLNKKTKGKSFPSRHIFSIYMVAMAMLFICPPVGILFLVLGVALAVIRVIAGVHFIKDVAAGALIGVGIGMAGFFRRPSDGTV